MAAPVPQMEGSPRRGPIAITVTQDGSPASSPDTNLHVSSLGQARGAGGRPDPVPEETVLTDKRSRNKIAAEKYRKKKREEQEKVLSQGRVLQRENEQLRQRVLELESELQRARDELARYRP